MNPRTMQAKPHATNTLWHAKAPPAREYPSLEQSVEADVAIIGGGITGLTAAMHLNAAGKSVVLLEAGRIGSGTTGGTSGHLEAMPDQGVKELIRDFGEDAARSVTQARMAAIEQIEGHCRRLEIDCDFRRIPAYVYSESIEGGETLQSQCDAAGRLGLEAIGNVRPPLSFTRGGFRVENQARIDSLRYIQRLAEHLSSEGVAIYEDSIAEPPSDGQPCRIETKRGGVAAGNTILATHSAFLGLSELDLRVAAYQSYILTARVRDDVPDALFWDDQQPYHYFRLASSDDPHLLVIGGCDHKTGQGGDERNAFEQLEDYASSHFQVDKIEHRWSAELFEPADGLPYVGRVPFMEHIHIATGFSGTGLTFGTMAGLLLAEQVLGTSSPLTPILTPSRIKPMAAGGTFLSENLNVARRFVTDRFGGETIDSLDEIEAGQGRLVRYGGEQRAVYRDEQGALHVFSPACTHAGCHVQWNEFESTWDCPCHGGRYSALGKRIYGPPAYDLKSTPLDEL